MSQENVEIVRRVMEAFNGGDFDAALRDVAPDADVRLSRSPKAAMRGGLEWHTMLSGTSDRPDGGVRALRGSRTSSSPTASRCVVATHVCAWPDAAG